MNGPTTAQQRDRLVDIASRVLGIAVFGSLLIAMSIIAVPKVMLLLVNGIDAKAGFDLLSNTADLVFLALLVGIFVVRHRPVRKQPGAGPRIAALLAALGLPYVVLLPRFDNPTAVLIAAFLGVLGNVFALVTLAKLGKSFSIFPEARRLITTGPYALVRHPLYLAEELVIIGMIVNHLHVVSVLAGLVHLGLQILRMGWEERVLESAFPEYSTYRSRVRRFLPWIW